MKRKAKNIPVRSILIAIAVLIGIFCLVRYIDFFVKSTDYFIVKDVVTNQPSIDISYLKGKNILLLDLKNESQRLRLAYPSYQKIILIRQFPNRIIAVLKNRIPLAYLELKKGFFVDSEGVLFSLPLDTPRLGLPLVVGLADKIPYPKEGSAYNSGDLRLTLSIISDFKRWGISKKYPIKRIVFSVPMQVSLFISDSAEIKLAKSDTAKQIRNLASLFNKARIDPLNVKYIDLRFKEPTVMFKDEK